MLRFTPVQAKNTQAKFRIKLTRGAENYVVDRKKTGNVIDVIGLLVIHYLGSINSARHLIEKGIHDKSCLLRYLSNHTPYGHDYLVALEAGFEGWYDSPEEKASYQIEGFEDGERLAVMARKREEVTA